MRREQLTQLLAYLAAGALAVGLAFGVSLNFIKHLRAQDTGVPTEQMDGEYAPIPEDQPLDLPPPENLANDGNVSSETMGEDPAFGAAPPAQDPAFGAAPPVQDPAAGDFSSQQPSEIQTQPQTSQAGESVSSGPTGLSDLEGFLEPFLYDSLNRRDPFQPYIEYAPQDVATPQLLSRAQRFALEELKLVGIMWDVKAPKAMFLDPEREVLVLGREESIGNRNGYIAAIREGEVVVVEATRSRGELVYHTRVLRLER